MEKRNFAFTLAETLIVIGIIGVVAALTIPTLNSETNSKDKVTKVKKAYSVLEDAVGRMVSDLGPINEWASIDSAKLTGKVASYMKTTKKCIDSTSISDKCFSASAMPIQTSGGVGKTAINGTYPSFLLADGISVSLISDSGSCEDVTGFDVAKVCGMAIIDVDGPSKGKDQYGLDLFAFYITPDGLTPVGLSNDTNYSFASTDGGTTPGACLGATDKLGCTAWVIFNGNMDYNKSNAGTCVDGTNGLKWDQGYESCAD